jgi:rfaE bifunctional protein kinase chain/domain
MRERRDAKSETGERSERSKTGKPSLLEARRGELLKHILGDLILDHYVWGEVSRISPEAPVPVVHVESESFKPGGAANVHHNIVALGGRGEVAGVVGADADGHRLLHEIGTRAGRGGIVPDPHRPTTRKTRVVAHHQQVVRYDIERRTEIPTAVQRRILRYMESHLREAACLVVSDYAKGVVTPWLMSELVRLAALRRIPLVVDPKVEHFSYYKGVTAITPNHLEAGQAVGVHAESDATVAEAGAVIRQRLGCHTVLITRGEKGMSLFEADGRTLHIPTTARQVFDVTGAGDTVLGTLALALATGATMADAALLANQAAGIVVGKVGTATASAAELAEAIAHG